MRKTCLVLALALFAALPACRKREPELMPRPATPPPVVPATPAPAPPPAEPRDVEPQLNEYDQMRMRASDEIDRMGLLKDVHFDLDRADIREGDRQILSSNADALKKFDFIKVSVEGHADERGTVEYNLALGDRRAKAAYDYLVSLGVAPERLKMVSYGKEVPLCQESNESCWAQNRRAHFAVTGKTR